MNKSPATKKRIAWRRVLNRMKAQGSYALDVATNFPMLLKSNFMEWPCLCIHGKNRQKRRYRLIARWGND